MWQYFELDYSGDPFVLFDAKHWTALGVIALVNVWLILRRKHLKPKYQKIFRVGLAIVLAANTIGYQTWNIVTGRWTIEWNLPLHLCSLLVWLSVFMLFTKNYWVYEFCYFLGIAGALQPLLTPDAGRFGFPHYYAFQFFISHGGIITAAVFMTAIEDFRPHLTSIKRVVIGTNLYLVVVTIINLLIGSNYMYSLHKPPVATLLDYLGPWPGYIFVAEGLGIILFFILYFPFAVKDFRTKIRQK
jgi:hypothetical integral membrane protein (TIGR02206 family)